MKPLPINLLPKKHRQAALRVPNWLWMFLAALGTVAAVHQGLRIIELRAQLRAAAEQAYGTSARAPANAPPPSAPNATPPPYLDDAKAIAALAAFDVAGALKAMESLREPGLRVVSAVIDAKERRARIDIEVSDLAQIARALDTLNAGEPTPLWRLMQAQAGAGGQSARATLETRQ